MKKYTIGLITGALLAISAMMFMGAQNKNLGDITVNSITVKNDGNGGFISISNSDGKERIYLGNGTKGYGLYTFNNDRNGTGFFGSNYPGRHGKVVLYDGYGGVGWSESGGQ